ncbi:MAG: CDP-glycerol glycerophosphotransferase family protein [Parachlamydiales bacterium]|nr:CDP-glycerol glycerophosphotransferase family protein [Parachlamydiales bacterium]
MRSAAFNTGPDYHLLDHIAPLAELMQCPLVVTEELNYELAKKFYPQVVTHFVPDLEFRFGEIAEQFDVLYECKYWQPHLKALFKTLYNKEMRLVFCPHGQSDKGYQAPVLAPYALQDSVLVYGQLMLDMLKELGIAVPSYTVVGNYRLKFYQKYKEFYDGLAPRIDRSKRTLLYAPTWCDLDDASSFFKKGAKVISELPDDWNLILKVHPLLKQRNPIQYELARLEKPNLFFLDEFPPVYPILSIADVFLGDSSSVGYDFLAFEKPLYFFPSKRLGRLHSCGTMIDDAKPIYHQLEKENRYIEDQRSLYRKAFN